MQRKLLVFLAGIWLFSALPAQETLWLNRHYRPERTEKNEVAFIYYRYQSHVLNLLHFKSVFPQTRDAFPDEVVILPPDLRMLEDTIFAVAYLKTSPGVPGIPVFMILGNTTTEYPLFFVDFNLDRDFTNDGDPLVFPKTEPFKSLEFQQRYEGNIYKYRLDLLNPLDRLELSPEKIAAPPPRAVRINPNRKNVPIAQLPVGRDERRSLYAEAAMRSRASARISTQFQVVMGFGRLSYAYFDPATRFPTEYEVNFNSKGFGTTIQYRLKNLRAGLYLRYENLFFWSSNKYTRLGEPYTLCTTLGGGRQQCTEIENVRRDINLDILPKNRSSIGLNLAYQFRLSRMSYLSPFANVYAQRYSNGYIANRYYRQTSTYAMKNQYGREAGLILLTDVTGATSVFFSAAFTSNGFRPEGFFDRNDVAGLRVRNLQGSFGLGVQARL